MLADHEVMLWGFTHPAPVRAAPERSRQPFHMHTPLTVPAAFMCATGDMLCDVHERLEYETGQEPAHGARFDDSKQCRVVSVEAKTLSPSGNTWALGVYELPAVPVRETGDPAQAALVDGSKQSNLLLAVSMPNKRPPTPSAFDRYAYALTFVALLRATKPQFVGGAVVTSMHSTPGVAVLTWLVNAYTLPVVVSAHPPDLMPA